MDWLTALPPTGRPPAYEAYLRGEYVPDEARPLIHVLGRRVWWMPWRRTNATVLAGMSEAMAFRAQEALDHFG